eukprot:10064198-Lingulodinium_polyedra.AAC.1
MRLLPRALASERATDRASGRASERAGGRAPANQSLYATPSATLFSMRWPMHAYVFTGSLLCLPARQLT